jgi:hypothetical protein
MRSSVSVWGSRRNLRAEGDQTPSLTRRDRNQRLAMP